MNFLRSEPASAPQSSSRFFVIDQNRNLYILDKTAKTFTPYINFEEVFPRFDNDPGFAGGLVTFAFDPDYADNGKFYTVHTEDPNKSGSDVPTNTSLPGLDLSGGYTTTTAVNPPAGTVARQAVLVEWTDTNRNDSTFEGTAREILRVGFNTNIFVAIPNCFEAGQIIERARALNPTLTIVARAHSEADVHHLTTVGAAAVIMGEREIARRMIEEVF